MRPVSLVRAAILGLGFVSLSACDKGGAGARGPSGEAHPLVGAPAPPFDLPAQAGSSRATLSSAQGKVAVVDFWATWCEPCRESFPTYEALSKKYGGDVVVFGISEDEEPEGIAGFARETGASFTLAWDQDKSVAEAYQPKAMPTSFLIDRNGLVRYVHSGFRAGDDQVIEQMVEGLVAP